MSLQDPFFGPGGPGTQGGGGHHARPHMGGGPVGHAGGNEGPGSYPAGNPPRASVGAALPRSPPAGTVQQVSTTPRQGQDARQLFPAPGQYQQDARAGTSPDSLRNPLPRRPVEEYRIEDEVKISRRAARDSLSTYH